MEDRFDVVAVRVEHEGAVVAGVVLGALAGRAVVAEAGLDARRGGTPPPSRGRARGTRGGRSPSRGSSCTSANERAAARDVEAARVAVAGRVGRPSARPSRRRAVTRRGRGRGSRGGRAGSRPRAARRGARPRRCCRPGRARRRRSRTASTAGAARARRRPGWPAAVIARHQSSTASREEATSARCRLRVAGRSPPACPIARSSHS